MTRFYGLSPLELGSLPHYLYAPLEEYLETLRAEELSAAILAATAPHLKKEDFRALNRRLQRILEAVERGAGARARPEQPVGLSETPDPEKAAAWFEERGVRVVKKKKEIG